MTSGRSSRANHLRLVEPANADGLAEIISTPQGRKQVQQLTQELVDALIEMTDLVDGEPDLESDGDETEDDDGI